MGVTTDLLVRLRSALGTDYRVDRELGAGGMARVFVARDLGLNRDVVIKVLPTELAAELSIERFRREIQLSAALQHPHIVPVLDAGELDGLPYYTMPYVQGESLRDRLTRAPLTVEQTLAILSDVARALGYAHRNGVVHRDIKPENVLLSDGIAVVTDFGIAKAISESAASTASTAAASLTRAGVSIGTPEYMAPEQAAADPKVDHRADIYSLGVLAYELFAGIRPFAGRTPRELFAAHLSETPPPLQTAAPTVPSDVARLVMRTLEKAPEARPQAAEDIVRVLDAATGALGAIEPTRLSRVVGLYAAACVMVTLLAWVSMVVIGLPDWVLPGAAVVMGLGAPVLALTAISRTPRYRQSLLGRLLSWRRFGLGGAVAIGGFAIAVMGFMVMRAAGVGPPGTLLAAGKIARHEPILVTDFSSAPGDSALARVVAAAVRAGLQRSDLVRVAAPERVAAVMRLMRRDVTEPLTLVVAQQVGRRERIPVIVDGDLVRSDRRLLLTVRLVAADSGTILASQTQVFSGPEQLIAAADKVSRLLRSKIGESLKQVRASVPLHRVTTGSFEALMLYTNGVRADDLEADRPKSQRLLEQAVALDSSFAMAWRKLFIVAQGPARVDALARAYRHRFHATDSERLVIEGTYYAAGGALWQDTYKSIAAYEALYAREGVPSNNLAFGLLFVRRFARAESLYRVSMALQPDNRNPPQDILISLMNQGKEDAADSAGRVARIRFPNLVDVRTAAAGVACGRRLLEACEVAMDSIRALPGGPHGGALNRLANLALLRGQLLKRERLLREVNPVAGQRPGIGAVQNEVALDLHVRRRPAIAALRLDSLGDSIPRRQLVNIAALYARAGRPERARELLARWQREFPDSIRQLLNQRIQFHTAQAEIALAESRWNDALRAFHAADRQPEGPVGLCAACLPLDLAHVHDAAARTDSAIASYEQFIATPSFGPPGFNLKEMFLPRVHERLGELHERQGNRSAASEHYAKFVDYWSSADPELQPRVARARQRLNALQPLRLAPVRRGG